MTGFHGLIIACSGLFVGNFAVFGDGGDPSLAWGEGDFCAACVEEAELAGLGGFFPGADGGGAILEDVGGAGADGGDGFVVAIGHAVLFDDHGDDDGGGDLDEFAACGGGDGAREVGRTVIDEVRCAIGVGAKISIGGGVVLV